MKRPAAALLGCIAILLLLTVAGIASIPSVQPGTWQPMGSMAAARSGATAVLLQDHRVLIAGGDGGSGAVNSAEVFNADGSFSGVSAMGTPRSEHVAVVLKDGRALVAGGVTAGGGATNSAEIYDPTADAWTAVAGGMVEARSGARASLLKDGRVVIVGGENGTTASATVEIFDPTTGQFSFAGTMSSPRMGLASASLADGRVLITGGSNGNLPVATSDVFDPTTNTVSAGPAMTSPRVGHSATALLDGRVLVAGGNNGSADLASAEVFDPATGGFASVAASLAAPRRDYAAILLPNNNTVLIVGGTSAGNEVATAETFVPWTGSFAATGSPAVARQQAAVSALNQDGLLLMAGGSSAGTSVSGAELYSFQTLKTDKPDYPPGTNVTITGTGWTPGEAVTLTLVESPLVDTHGPYTALVQADGTFTNSSFTTDQQDFAIHFTLTAVGSISQAQAQTTFWDNKNLTVTFAGTGSGSISSSGGSGSINCTDSSGTASGPKCSDSFGNTDTVTLTETPTAPAVFGGWNVTGGATITSGTCTSSSPTCTFGMNNNAITATATFNPGPAAEYLVSASNNNPAAGSQITITAQLADSGGNPVHTAAKVVTWSKTGTGGSFSAATSNTNANGIATVNFTTGAVAGTVYTFTATDNSSFTGTSGDVTTVAGPLAQLVFIQQPTSSAAGVVINPAVQVQLRDANGNVLTNDNGTNIAMVIQTNPSAGTLGGTTTVADVNGVVTFGDLSINKIGTGYTLRANRGGTTVTSAPFNITARTTATSVSLNPTSVQPGGSSQVTVTVTDSGAGTQSNPAGTIALTSSDIGVNGDTFTTCTLAPSGGNAASCTATVTAHEVGSSPHTITATYTPTDSVHGGSNGSAGLTVVNPATTTSVTSSSAGNSSTFGDTVTFTATVTSGSGTPTGNVTFIEGTTCPGTALTGSAPNPVTLAGGQASFTTAALNAGSHTITACFSPTGNFTASNGSVTQTVSKATPTTNWANPADIAYGTALSGTQLNATFSWVINGSPVAVAGTAIYNPASGTVLNAGNGQNLTVNFTPNDTANYNAATKTVQINVLKATPSVTVTDPSPTYDGNPHSATANATGVGGANVAGSFTFTYDGSGTAPTNAKTSYAVVASFTSSDPNYNDAVGNGFLTILKADSTTVVSVAGGESFTYDGNAHPATVSVTGVGGLALSPAPAYSCGHAPMDVADSGCIASYSFPGDANHKPSSDSKTYTIAKADSTTVVSVAGGESFTYDGNAHPATVSVTGVGGLALSPAPAYSCGHAPMDVADSGCIASYSFPGDANHKPSSDSKTYTIAKADSTTVVSVAGGESFTYDGNAHPATVSVTGVGGLALSPAPVYSCGHAPSNVADSGCTASYSFAGDANHKPSSDSKTYTIAKADSTTVVSVAGGTSFTYDALPHPATVSVTGVGGLNLAPAPVYSCGHAPMDVADSGCTASYSFAGDDNHKPSSDLKTYTIAKADSTTVVSVAGGTSFTYDALPHPATVSVTGVGGLALSPAPVYSCGHAPMDVADSGCTASFSFAGDDNHKPSSDTKTYMIAKANSSTAVSVAGGTSFTYDGLAHPATVSVTGVGGLNLAPAPVYSCGHAPINVADSGCTASYSFTGDSNHNPSADSKTYAIAKANPTITVTPYNVAYDGLSHTATGTAKGVQNENLSGLSLTGTTHTNPGDYPNDAWIFADVTGNYNNAGSTVHDFIGYGVCSAAIGPGSVILPPINSDGSSVYQRKGGSTIPVKFRVCAANGSAISNPAAVFAGTVGPLTMLSAVRGTVTNVNEADGTDIPDAAFRWDASGQQWIFNMATSNLSSGNTYLFRINLANGSIQFVVGVK